MWLMLGWEGYCEAGAGCACICVAFLSNDSADAHIT